MTHSTSEHKDTRLRVLIPIGVLIVTFVVALATGIPQRATHRIAVAAQAEHEEQVAEEAARAASTVADRPADEGTATTADSGDHAEPAAANTADETPAPDDGAGHAAAHAAGHGPQIKDAPPVWTVLPFALLLGAIAILPLIPATAHWWESNLNKFYLAAALAVATLVYFLVFHEFPVEGHWIVHHVTAANPQGLNVMSTWDVFANAILQEYVPFIVLLFSLYTISGGVRLQGDLPAHPLTNTIFMAIGAVLASLIGTTGAAMILIRALLETNSERKHVAHTVIFFIFIVCNCGGLLLPTGDPPLFLGYLMGVPFLWTSHLLKEWAFVNGSLLVIYYLWDHFWFYPHETKRDIVVDETLIQSLRVQGLWLNGPLLIGVILSVALLDPSKAFPGTDWHPWLYLREATQLGLVGLSLALGRATVRRENGFNYHAIIEVAALFFGIFICMQPALQILGVSGPRLGLHEPWHFFWATGALSSFLDNAPTYVVFFKAAQSLTAAQGLTPAVAGVAEHLLVAISLGAVFMGANTYIGNGPNFMAKSIAESSGVKMPSFFGYMAYSVGILIPLFILCTYLFID